MWMVVVMMVVPTGQRSGKEVVMVMVGRSGGRRDVSSADGADLGGEEPALLRRWGVS
jgi:hypothetical protein